MVWKQRATTGKWEMAAAATAADPATEHKVIKEIMEINHQNMNREVKTSWKLKWV
ncbi:hypothetical protein [Paenibacillus taihuensis]|uniref:hypothetical protein n=1 Tax=Paenibacillus taihuensis TaxID=1156355 RepID=UPI0015F2955F|nr:hypothetical protein [Paenibacillus taihuensis]